MEFTKDYMLIESPERELDVTAIIDALTLFTEDNRGAARYELLQKYYKGDDVEYAQSEKSTELGVESTLKVNHGRKLVETFEGYASGGGVTISHPDDETINDALNTFRKRSRLTVTVRDVLKYCDIYGRGFLQIYTAEESTRQKLLALPPTNTFCVYDNTMTTERSPLYAVTYAVNDEGTAVVVNVYDNENVYVFEGGDISSVEEVESYPHFYDGCPIVEFRQTTDAVGIIEPIISQLDAYNATASAVLSDVETFKSLILKMINVPFDESSLDDVKKYRTMLISLLPDETPNSPASQGKSKKLKQPVENYDISYIEKPTVHATQEYLLSLLDTKIHEMSGIPKMDLGGNPSGITMAYRYSEMSNKASEREDLVLASILRVMEIMASRPDNGILTIDSVYDLDIELHRNTPRDDTASAALSELDMIIKAKTAGIAPELYTQYISDATRRDIALRIAQDELTGGTTE